MKIAFKRKYFWPAIALLAVCPALQAQNDADLLRYSMLNPIGTARYNAMGGAFGALGANFTSLSTNPAGIGFYTRHEISLTGGIVAQKGESDYYGESYRLNKTRVAVPQGGGVFGVYQGSGEPGKLRSLQFAIGANRLKDFNTNVYMQGVNTQSSYMEDVAARSAGLDFLGQHNNVADIGNLAFQTGLLDRDSSNMDDMLYKTFLGPGLRQTRVLQESGNITELALSFGGNWSDQLYFGLTLGIPIVDYSRVSIVGEENTEQSLPHSFRSYELKQRTDVNGTGINLKLGLIYKPVRFFRVGLAFHTPTYYWLKEGSSADLNTQMRYAWEDLDNYARYSFTDRYNVVTPLKGVLSLGFLVRNFGSFSIEGELTDYRAMRLEVNDFSYENYIQNIVKDNYRLSGVVRVGTEWKVNILSIRAGYIWQSCPYKNETLKQNWSNHTATAGLGLALGSWNLDFGFMADLGKRTDDFYYLVDGSTNEPLVQPARLGLAKYIYTLTLGYRF